MKNTITILLLFLCSTLTQAQVVTTSSENNPETAKMKQWWAEDKFGLFIHWGLYSLYAGEFEGKKTSGLAEWIQYQQKIPLKQYKKGLKDFNPSDFDALKIAKMAKAAGMKYLVFTAKHHDGFAMYDSKVSDYNIVEQTPYGKDPLAALDKACKTVGIKLGVYYSHVIDWQSPYAEYYVGDDGVSRNNYWDFSADSANYERFYREKSLPQLQELLSNYDVSLLWLDMGGQIPERYVKKYSDEIKRISPKTIVNSRIAPNVKKGESHQLQYYDYRTTADNFDEGAINDGSAGSFPFEVAATMNTSWGDKKGEQDWKPFSSLLESLVDIVSKGGNYLLNIGPDAKGNIAKDNVVRLSAFSDWMKYNSEAIHGTKPSPFKQAVAWGRFTRKDDLLYAIILHWPVNDQLNIPGLVSKVGSVSILGTDENIAFKQSVAQGIHALDIKLPKNVDKKNTVLKIKVKDAIQTQDVAVEDKQGKIILSRQYMDVAQQAWDFRAKGGKYQVTVTTGESHSHEKGKKKWLGAGLTGELYIDNKSTLPILLRKDSRSYDPQKHFWDKIHTHIGQVTLTAGQHTLALKSLLLNDSKYAAKGALLLDVTLEKL